MGSKRPLYFQPAYLAGDSDTTVDLFTDAQVHNLISSCIRRYLVSRCQRYLPTYFHFPIQSAFN